MPTRQINRKGRHRFILEPKRGFNSGVSFESPPLSATERDAFSSRIKHISSLLPPAPRGFGPPCADRAAWRTVRNLAYFAHQLHWAREQIVLPCPQISEENYLRFHRDGDRQLYEQPFLARRDRLRSFVLAECLEPDGRFAQAAAQEIACILEEKTWCLPAHDPDLDFLEGRAIPVDLAVCSRAWTLASADHLLGDLLPHELRRGIRQSLRLRFFQPFIESVRLGRCDRGWFWRLAPHNWNAVCHASLVGAALTILESREERAEIIAAAEQGIRHYLAGFRADGYCTEGLHYWNYGFGHFTLLAESVFRATEGKLDFWRLENVSAIASYGRRIEMRRGLAPWLSDCPPETVPMEWICQCADSRLGIPLGQPGEAAPPDYWRLLYIAEMMAFPGSAGLNPCSPHPVELRDWFPDSAVYIGRPAQDEPRSLSLALKGGHNGEHHNHNDVGVIVVAVGPVAHVVDPGQEIYTKRTFGAHRYESAVNSSRGHSVPWVEGVEQSAGRDCAAKVISADFSPITDQLVFDLSSAYPAAAPELLLRELIFERSGAGHVIVRDSAVFDRPRRFGTALITFSHFRQTGPQEWILGEGVSALRVIVETPDHSGFLFEQETLNSALPAGRRAVRLGWLRSEPSRRPAIELRFSPA